MLSTNDLQSQMRAAELAKGKLPAGVTDRKKWEVAQQFEAMFSNEMIKSMRAALPKSELQGASAQGMDIFTGMLDSEYSNMMARQSGGRGLAMQVYRQLERAESGAEATMDSGPKDSRFHGNAILGEGSSTPSAHAGDLVDILRKAAAKHGVDPELLQSMATQESALNPKAQSPVGAKGLLQLMDGTAREMGVKNVWDAQQNAEGGAKYLSQMLQKFGGDTRKALAAYNAGPGNVQKFDGVPPFSETQNYVREVLARKSRLER